MTETAHDATPDARSVSVVTGVAGGIGARRLATRGPVVLADLDEGRLDGTATAVSSLGTAVRTASCDVADEASVDAPFGVAEAHGGLLGRSAGRLLLPTISRADLAEFLLREAVEGLRPRGADRWQERSPVMVREKVEERGLWR